MYITNKYICFYSNLFGLEKKIRIPYSHIKSITKENTAMVIPNAIAIATDKKDYVFRSFWDREECHRILITFLEKFRGGGKMEVNIPRTQSDAPMPVIDQLQHGSEPVPANESSGPSHLSSRLTTPTTNAAEDRTSSVKRLSTPVTRPASSSLDHQTSEDVIDAESGPKVERPASATIDISTVFQQEASKSKFKITVTSGVFDVSLKDFMALFVDETAPFSYKKYHESVKDTNLNASLWEENPTALSFGREIKFFKPVNLPGLASTRGVKIQKYRKFGDYGLLLWSSTRLEDVPAADTFSVDDLLAVNVVSEKSVNVEITFQVTFLKSTFLRSIIESNTNSEMKKWLETFFNHLKKTTELYRDGKISLDSPDTNLPVEVSPPEEVKAAPTENVKEKKSTSQNDSLFALLLGFNNETLGDRVKAITLLMLIGFIIYQHLTYKAIYRKLNDNEAKIKILEGLLKEAVDRLNR